MRINAQFFAQTHRYFDIAIRLKATPFSPEDYRLGREGEEIPSVILHREGSKSSDVINPVQANY